MKINTRLEPPSYRYAHHMGSGEYVPGYAEAWVDSCKNDPVHVQFSGGDEQGQAALEKAVAILRNRLVR